MASSRRSTRSRTRPLPTRAQATCSCSGSSEADPKRSTIVVVGFEFLIHAIERREGGCFAGESFGDSFAGGEIGRTAALLKDEIEGLNLPGIEERHGKSDARAGEPFERFRAIAGGNEFAEDHLVFADAGFVEDENFLKDDVVAIHAGNFGDVDDFASAVSEAADLDDEIDGGSDLGANYGKRNLEAAHGDHGLEAADGVVAGASVNGGERAVVAGVHGLEHVECFVAADFADDDAVGAHTQSVDYQAARRNGAGTFDVGRTRLEPHDVILLEAEFGGVFNSDDALARRDIRREKIEQRGLARARAAGDDDVHAREDAGAQEFEHGRGESVILDEIVGGEQILARNGGCKGKDRREREEG